MPPKKNWLAKTIPYATGMAVGTVCAALMKASGSDEMTAMTFGAAMADVGVSSITGTLYGLCFGKLDEAVVDAKKSATSILENERLLKITIETVEQVLQKFYEEEMSKPEGQRSLGATSLEKIPMIIGHVDTVWRESTENLKEYLVEQKLIYQDIPAFFLEARDNPNPKALTDDDWLDFLNAIEEKDADCQLPDPTRRLLASLLTNTLPVHLKTLITDTEHSPAFASLQLNLLAEIAGSIHDIKKAIDGPVLETQKALRTQVTLIGGTLTQRYENIVSLLEKIQSPQARQEFQNDVNKSLATIKPKVEAIKAKLDSIEMKVQQIHDAVVSPGHSAEKKLSLVKKYVRQLERQFDELPSFFEQLGDKVSSIYVRVSISPQSDVVDVKPLDELLEESSSHSTMNRWFVEGKPGSGKSTMAKQIARQYAEKVIKHQDFENGCIPVYVNLPEFARLLKENSQAVFKGFELGANELQCDGETASLLEDIACTNPERIALFIDGLDEVDQKAATEACKAITNLADGELKGSRICIFSRPRMKMENWRSLFSIATVVDLDAELQTLILSNWIDDEALVAKLVKEILPRSFGKFSDTPLGLALFALVYLDYLNEQNDESSCVDYDNFDLDKSQVIGLAIDALLKGVYRNTDADPVITPKLDWLSAIAFHLHDNLIQPKSKQDIERAIKSILAEQGNDFLRDHLRSVWKDQIDLLTNELYSSTGVVNPKFVKNKLFFRHRIFQEYLSARWLTVISPDGKKALEICNDLEPFETQRWQQVIGISCSLLEDRNDVINLLNALRSKSPKFAFSVAVEADSLTPRERLDYITKRHNQQAGKEQWTADIASELLGKSSPTHELLDSLMVKAVRSNSISEVSKIFFLLFKHFRWEHEFEGKILDESRFFKLIGLNQIVKPDIAICKVAGGPFRLSDGASSSNEVSLQDFSIARTPVTNLQFHQFRNFKNSSPSTLASDQENLPSVNVSWYESLMFCRWMNMDLPTEMQWEYCCRGANGSDPDSMRKFGWFKNNSDLKVPGRRTIQEVAQLSQNDYGLFDMQGNVWEWCRDWYAMYDARTRSEKIGLTLSAARKFRVCRGGCFNVDAAFCDSKHRNYGPPEASLNCVGFRPVKNFD